MSFVHAPVTKGTMRSLSVHLQLTIDLRHIALMLWLGTSALLIGVFDIKHYLHLQVRLYPVTPLEC